MESILDSIKQLLGIEQDDTAFDQEIIMYINGGFSFLNQLGVGPKAGYQITNKSNTWSEILHDRLDLDFIKNYIYCRVRLIFDPPQNSFLVDALKTQIAELEWRINVQAETPV